MKILVTGGTTFVSRFTAEYFAKKGNEVYVLNRGNGRQSRGVRHIKADRHNLGDSLNGVYFDAVLDITAYNDTDIKDLLDGLGDFDNYIFVSSSAVYPETLKQPFNEKQNCGANSFWGDYGLNKIKAEEYLISKVPNAYIVRPPYLYGPMNNLYREAFVFDCAEKDLAFYLPKDGSMPLQFFDVEDLCKFFEVLIENKPKNHIFNVGNSETISVKEWVQVCYKVLGKEPKFEYIFNDISQKNYFPFLDYGYVLDTTKQNELMSETKPFFDGLCESYEWYRKNKELVRRKPLIEFINGNLK